MGISSVGMCSVCGALWHPSPRAPGARSCYMMFDGGAIDDKLGDRWAGALPTQGGHMSTSERTKIHTYLPNERLPRRLCERREQPKRNNRHSSCGVAWNDGRLTSDDGAASTLHSPRAAQSQRKREIAYLAGGCG